MTTTPDLLATLTSYTPMLVRKRIVNDPGPRTEPAGERFTAAVLLADLVDFAALTEKLNAEALAQLLNTYFDKLIDIITGYNGDVVKFAGDALLAVWPDPDSRAATLRAAKCALDIQNHFRRWRSPSGQKLALQIGISAGELVSAHIGGMYGRWEFLLAGEPVVQANLAQQDARPGNIIIAKSTWAQISDDCLGYVLPGGNARLTTIRRYIPSPVIPAAIPSSATALQAYIPAAIRTRLLNGQTDGPVGLCNATVLFANLPGFNHTSPLAQTQTVMLALQKTLYRYESSINKLLFDDKGLMVLAVLGLPPLAHEDDPVRGILAAIELQAALHTLGLQSNIGVTTGQMFCGVIGNATRREYTIIGDPVNVAAQLMQHVSGGILCDATTYNAARDKVDFLLPPAKISIKGKVEPITVYRPQRANRKVVRRTPKTALVGRQQERKQLITRAQSLSHNHSGVVIIEGAAGLGKSRLVEELLHEARILGLSILIGSGDAIEQNTGYHAWRPVFSRVFSLASMADDATDPDTQRVSVLGQLKAILPDLAELAPLLSAVLPFDIPDNETTAKMSGQVRADKTQKLLAAVLKAAAAASPRLLLLDDAHWLDSASWALIRLLAHAIQPLLLVVATRPFGDPPPREYAALRNAPNTLHLQLNTLPPAAIESLVRQSLGIASLPQPLAALIYARGGGQPLYSQELAYALRDAGFIKIENGQCQIAADVDLSTITLPDTLPGLIASRLARLTVPQQLVTKAASVIGRVFTCNTLHSIYPAAAGKPELHHHLDVLEQLDVTLVEAPDPALAYSFKHNSTQAAAYNSIDPAQQREFHRAVAEWHERTYNDELTHLYPLLAHHWQQADVLSKAIDYLEKAGEQALRNDANKEAISFFDQALTLAGQQPSLIDAEHQARWHTHMAQAWVALGQLPTSAGHARQALNLLGEPFPSAARQLRRGTLGQIIRQAPHLLRPKRFSAHANTDADLPERTRTLQRAYDQLAYVYYLTNEARPLFYATLRHLNLAESIGTSHRLARAYAQTCIAAGLASRQRLAERYRKLAENAARHTHQPGTRISVALLTSRYQTGVGQWSQAETALETALADCEELGDRRQWSNCMAALALSITMAGAAQRGATLYHQLADAARSGGHALQQIWALQGQALYAIRRGQLDDAVALTTEAQTLLARHSNRVAEINVQGLLGLAQLRQRQLPAARRALNAAAAQIGQSPPTTHTLYPGYASMTEGYLRLWAQSINVTATAAEQAELQQLAKQACDHLHTFGRVFPIGRPVAWLYQGLYDWLASKPRKARRAWQKALKAAQQLKMPFETGLAHYEIGRHLPATNPERQTHLQQATEIFIRLNADHHLAQVQRTVQ